MRRDVVALLCAAGLDAMAVENPCLPGTPDVECIPGWIELKILTHWPKVSGAVKLPKFRPGQRIWLRRRAAAGGSCWLLLRVRSDWLLFEGGYAARMVGHVSREELYRNAKATWSSKQNMKEDLPRCLSRLPN